MPKQYRLYLILTGLGIGLIVTLLVVYNVVSSSSRSPDIALSVPQEKALASSGKPIEGWYICADLGVGPVPERVKERQRFILCHPDGYEIKTYCLNPNLPNPPFSAQCTRIGELTYWCGSGVQPVKEYYEPPPPTPNFTATYTPTPTATYTPTPTATPTATPTKRPNSGGPGFRDLYNQQVKSNQALATSTPFEPLIPLQTKTSTPFVPLSPLRTATPTALVNESDEISLHSSKTSDERTNNFYGIDLNNHAERIRIKIIPPDKRVNGGKPILISFIPGQSCQFGDQQACVTTTENVVDTPINFLSIHSGIGGEAQAFRHALEGTGYDQAAYNLKDILKNVNALRGAEVIIYQGDKELKGFKLTGTSRIPSKNTRSYFDLPLPEAFWLAAEIDPSLKQFSSIEQPIIVFETCGWRAPGEKWVSGLRNTQAAVYIGVIQKVP